MSAPEASPAPGAARIDRWLFAVRLFGSRPLAAAAVAGGRVHVNGTRVKPSHALRPGDEVRFMRGAVEFSCQVLCLPLRRGPAREALRAYAEQPESLARRTEFGARMKLAAALTPRPRARPDKHQRAQLRRLRGRI
ncbi:MAG TPA: S4 domain-containing protein [Steroidobacteraceae bacterium]|jgi:ribosome-associated heat shock protein Hsp15|nr:S4 domain-containing protein [Steroidobacteraceae bacterium]